MPELDPLKARIETEYDGSGVDQAKEDLASLMELAGSSSGFGQAISGALSDMYDQFAAGSSVFQDFGESIGILEKPLGAGQLAIGQMASSLLESRDAILEAQGAFDQLGPSVGTTVEMLDTAPGPIAQIAQHATAAKPAIEAIDGQFTELNNNLTQLPDNVDSASQALGKGAQTWREQFGLPPDFALQFDKNGQIVGAGAEIIGQQLADMDQKSQAAASSLQDLNNAASAGGDTLVNTGKAASTASEDINTLNTSTAAATDQFTAPPLGTNGPILYPGGPFAGQSYADATGASPGSSGSYGNGLIGPPPPTTYGDGLIGPPEPGLNYPEYTTVGMVDYYQQQQAAAWQQILNPGASYGNGLIGPAEPDYAFTAPGEGGLDLGAMMAPMMAISFLVMGLQAVGQAAQQFMVNLYQMSTLMEGPAAHSAGTFTGTVDALGQTLQNSNMQFSDSFGKQIIPLLDVANNLASGSNGAQLGTTLGYWANAGVGSVLDLIFPGASQMLAQAETSAAAGAQPVPLSPAQRYTMTQLSQMPQTVDMSAAQANIQADQMLAEALSPDYLAAVQNTSVAQRVLQQAQLRYNSMNPPESPQMLLSDYQFASYASGQGYTPDQIAYMEQASRTKGGWTGTQWAMTQDQIDAALGITSTAAGGGFSGIGIDLGGLGGLGNLPGNIMHTLSNVFGSIGSFFFQGGIGDMFANIGKTIEGWNKAQPDPNAAGGGVGVGVGNNLGAQIASMVANIQLPHIDLSGLTASISSAFSSWQPPQISFSGLLSLGENIGNQISSIFSNFQPPQINFSSLMSFGESLGSQISQIGSAFSNFQMPQINFSTLMDIGSGIMSQINSVTSNIFSDISIPQINFSTLMSIGSGIMSQIDGFTSSMFSNLQPPQINFSGLMNIGQSIMSQISGFVSNLQGVFSSISATLSIPGIPLYASGVQGAPPGLAVVGENGPELLMMAGGESVYPMSSLGGGGSFPSIFGDGGGNLALTLNNIITLDGRIVAQQVVPYMAPMARLAAGVRSK